MEAKNNGRCEHCSSACAYPTEFEFLIFACYPLIVFCSSYALMLDIVVKSFHAATRMTRPNGTKPEHYELKRPHESLGLPFRCPVPNSSLLSKGPDGILKIETNGIHSSSSGPLARPGIDQVELQAAPTGDTIGSRAIASSPDLHSWPGFGIIHPSFGHPLQQPRKKSAWILMRTTNRQAAVFDSSELHVRQIIQKRASSFVDRRDLMAKMIRKVS
ncbi:hypothetical protein Pst134EA_026688 [Puccinia striiformis f. sp. tritici]|uniref:hypothetical protein n=1 Tax=Puccinia striiformis f. sp. tritici TaxID=168172 RepID=UPI0020077110|nr:hypothetical protein Pst134EA_026688 [Puccinia striiformis f. sp. tritici]KAH9449976.1 hypothetical protein Pst134EA_026688 [Puccinia striiformis f. sp. tritici]